MYFARSRFIYINVVSRRQFPEERRAGFEPFLTPWRDESNYRAGENSETRGRSFLQRGNSRKSQTSRNTRKSRILRRRVYHEGEENSRWRKVERSRIYTRIPILRIATYNK